jgi:hypothetical protein
MKKVAKNQRDGQLAGLDEFTMMEDLVLVVALVSFVIWTGYLAISYVRTWI